MRTPPIFLASSSPRRKMLLTQAGLKIKIVSSSVNEKIVRGENAENMVLRLAVQKAEAGLLRLSKATGVIVAADTCVVAPGGHGR